MLERTTVLRFPHDLVTQAVICELTRTYNLEFSILNASITPHHEGHMVLAVSGDEEDYRNGFQYLVSKGVHVKPIADNVKRLEDRCTHCGVCIGACAFGALSKITSTQMIEFDSRKCLACGLCVTACPTRAMKVEI